MMNVLQFQGLLYSNIAFDWIRSSSKFWLTLFTTVKCTLTDLSLNNRLLSTRLSRFCSLNDGRLNLAEISCLCKVVNKILLLSQSLSINFSYLSFSFRRFLATSLQLLTRILGSVTEYFYWCAFGLIIFVSIIWLNSIAQIVNIWTDPVESVRCH